MGPDPRKQSPYERRKRMGPKTFVVGDDGKKRIKVLRGGKPVKESPEQPGLHGKPSKFLSGGQTKIAKKAPPFDEIDEKDFAVLRAEKAKGKGKVMKAKRGKFSDLRKLAKAKGLPAPSPLLAGKGFGKMAGNFPAIKTAPGSVASKAEVKQGTKRLGKFIPRRLKLVGAALSAAGVGAVGQKLIDKMKKKKKKKELEGDIKGSIAPYKMKKKMGGGLAAATERLRAQGKMGGGMMKKYNKGMTDKTFTDPKTALIAHSLKTKDKITEGDRKAAKYLEKKGLPGVITDGKINRGRKKMGGGMIKKYSKGMDYQDVIRAGARDKAKVGEGKKFRAKTFEDKGRLIPDTPRNRKRYNRMGGGMMNKPMGYKSGKSVMAKGCKLGRKKPTKMYT
jgi:hypothetical protein